jgi:hypothetical protein
MASKKKTIDFDEYVTDIEKIVRKGISEFIKPEKKIIDGAIYLAASGLQGGSFENRKPEEVADFCVAVAKRIHDYDIDGDIDKD